MKSPSTTYVIGQELVLGKHCWWVLVCDGEVCESKKEDFLDRTEVEGADLKVRCTSQGGPNHKMCLSPNSYLAQPLLFLQWVSLVQKHKMKVISISLEGERGCLQ